jgi:hypothetical protein
MFPSLILVHVCSLARSSLVMSTSYADTMLVNRSYFGGDSSARVFLTQFLSAIFLVISTGAVGWAPCPTSLGFLRHPMLECLSPAVSGSPFSWTPHVVVFSSLSAYRGVSNSPASFSLTTHSRVVVSGVSLVFCHEFYVVIPVLCLRPSDSSPRCSIITVTSCACRDVPLA